LEKEQLPLDEQNKAFKVKFLMRKGAAHHALGQSKQTIRYYQSALEIDPKNPALKADLQQLLESL
jgi:tetratricopeptide (TPR) repeat protein